MANNDNHINVTGKIAKFPKNYKAFDALKYLEKVKVNPNKIWYIIIESQENELKLVKYNRSKGVDLLEYTLELKNFYRIQYKNDKESLALIEGINVVGEEDFSLIKNIPNIMVNENLDLVSKIASDLIKLLAN